MVEFPAWAQAGIVGMALGLLGLALQGILVLAKQRKNGVDMGGIVERNTQALYAVSATNTNLGEALGRVETTLAVLSEKVDAVRRNTEKRGGGQ